MKRISAVLCVFIALLTQQAGIAESVLDNRPDWLNGILSIDLYGADTLEESWPLDRYICTLDFNRGRVDKIKIPDGSIYTKEWKDSGSPVIIYPSEHGYYFVDDYSQWRWREVSFVKIMQLVNGVGTQYTYGKPWRDFWTGEEIERAGDDDNVYYETSYFKSPMKILGIKSEFNSDIHRDQVSVIILQYGISDKGDVEIQLVREEDTDFPEEKKQILYCFSLNHDFGAWQYSISRTGSVAWYEGMNTLFCSGVNGVKSIVPNGRVFGCPVWYDEKHILFFEAKDDHCIFPTETVLKKWDISNDTVEDFLDENDRLIEGGICPFTMALNDGKKILAVYGWTENESKIKIINLDNGETYTLNPWPDYLEEDAYEMLRYGYAEDGTVYFDPADCLQSQLVWFPE